jgi:hypothetical protein
MAFLQDSGQRRRVIVRTHGGLGNQIFQILFARLYAESRGAQLCEIHDARYEHKFARDPALSIAVDKVTGLQSLVSALRIPKILTRMGFQGCSKIRFIDEYLDGYFQNINDYRPFEFDDLKVQILRIRDEICIGGDAKYGTLVHLRLGDFFATRDEARAYAVERVTTLPKNCAIMTNDEAILMDDEIAQLIQKQGCTIYSTAGFGPTQTLSAMAEHEKIVSNDSTLAFWAAVLARRQLEISHPPLKLLYSYFSVV